MSTDARTTEMPRRHAAGRGVWVVAVALCAVVALVATFVAMGPAARRVVVVGDSITFYAGNDITAALGPGYRADVKAGIGRRIDQMLPAVQAAARGRPYAVVVNLGTNDALQAVPDTQWRPAFDAMIDALAPVHCALLTTISTLVRGRDGTPEVAARIDAALATAVRAHAGMHLVDWNAAVHGPGGANLLMPDDVHPSSAGQLVLAGLVRNGLRSDCSGG